MSFHGWLRFLFQPTPEEDARYAARHQQLIDRIESLTTEVRTHRLTPSPEPLWKQVREWLTVAIGIGAVCTALGALCIYGRQLNAMQSQVNVAQQQLTEMEAEQRAWAALSEGTGPVAMENDGNGSVSVTITWAVKDVGKDAADIAYVNQDISVASQIPHGSFGKWQAAVCAAPQTLPNRFLFPVSLEPTFIDSQSLDKNDVARLNGVIAPFVVACIVYRDAVTQKWHKTPYLFKLIMRKARPGHGCCAIVLGDLPLKDDEVVLQTASRSDLIPPD
jgi:hypothetical protein